MGSISASDFRDRVLSKKIIYEASAELYYMQAGQLSKPTDKDRGIVLWKDELEKTAGYFIKVPFSPFLSGDGREGDRDLVGYEEDLTVYNQNTYIDQIRHAVVLKGNMDEKKVAYSMRMQAKTSLTMWLSRYVEHDMLYKQSGITTKTFGLNTPTAPSTYRTLFGGNATSTADIDSSDKLDLAAISKAKVLAKTEVSGVPIIQPLRGLPKGVRYVLFVHEYQAYDLKRDSEWNQNQREAALRGVDNLLFQDAIGMHDGVLIVPHPFIQTYSTWGALSDQPGARALLCGQQSLSFATGSGAQWVEESRDFKNKWAISCGMIFGCQKTKFNSIDFGTISLDTYAVNPNA